MSEQPTSLTVRQPNAAELMRHATDAAGVSRDIVMRTACTIQHRKYVKVEGWQAIAVAHGCILSARDVERIGGEFPGIRAIGEVRRISDQAVLATAEGFVGDAEGTWGKRDEYAKRAMAQTRAMSRAARSAFAHVVVMIDSDLSTTPAEEVPEGGFHEPHAPAAASKAATPPAPAPATPEPSKAQAKPGDAYPRRPMDDDHKKAEGVKVESVKEKSGTTAKGKRWTVRFIKFSDGTEAATFDDKLADIAIEVAQSGEEVAYAVKPSERSPDKLDLISIEKTDALPF